MTQHQTPRHEIGETVHLPLSKLVMSRENPRKTKPNTRARTTLFRGSASARSPSR